MKRDYFKLSDAIVKMTGAKAAQFLHGQLTNSISDLPAMTGNYNLLLNNKGKVQASLFVLNRGAFFELIVPSLFFNLVKNHFDPLTKLMRCEILDVTAEYNLFHLVCDDVAGFSNAHVDEIVEKDIYGCKVLLYRSDRLGVCGFDVRVLQQDKQSLTDFFKKNGFSELPYVDVDVTAGHLLREGKLNRAINFNKGCYLGQEIVARLKRSGYIK